MDPYVKQWLKNIIKIRIMLDPNMMKTLPMHLAAKNPAMAKQMIVNTVRREGISYVLLKHLDQSGGIAISNQGGLLGVWYQWSNGFGNKRFEKILNVELCQNLHAANPLVDSPGMAD